MDFPSGGGGEAAGILELIVDHTVTAEEAAAVSITFTKEKYPLIDGQKFLFLRVVKPTAATGWWALKANNVEIINGAGSSTQYQQLAFAMVAHGLWLQSESQGSNANGSAYLPPNVRTNYGAYSSIHVKPYAYYDRLTLSSYTTAWPEGTTIEIYGGK